MSTELKTRYRVQVLDRAMALLEALADERHGATLVELSDRLRMHRSTVYRLLTVLEQHRLVSRNSGDGRYRLGFRFFELAGRFLSKLDLPQRARPHLERLVLETGETCHVCILDEYEVLYLEKVEGPRAVRAPSIVGRRYPAHCGAAGKALLAFLPPRELEELIRRRGLKAYTSNTITTPAQLKAELQRVRERGYSIDNEEYEEGLKCIGAPVRDFSGNVVASISMAGPAFRIAQDKIPLLARSVLETAEQISSELGYRQTETKQVGDEGVVSHAKVGS